MPRGDSARSTGAELAELVGLDEGEHLGVIRSEQDDDKVHPVLRGGVRLQAGDAQLEIGSRHDVQHSGIEPEPEARPKLDPSARQPLKAALDGLDRVLGREQLGHLGFAEIERHGGGVV